MPPPTPTEVLTALVSSLSPCPPSTTTIHDVEQSGSTLPPSVISLLQTLHTLLPHTTLDALDLLDRGCVTRLTVQDTYEAQPRPSSHENQRNTRHEYFVSSASSTSNPEHVYAKPKRYHVHTQAWNCECPVFVLGCYSGFSSATGDSRPKGVRYVDLPCSDAQQDGNSAGRCKFGGLSRRRVRGLSADEGVLEGDAGSSSEVTGARDVELAPPVCKHLLAAVLAEECGWLFGPRPTVSDHEGHEERLKVNGRKGLREVSVSVRKMAEWVASGGEDVDV